MWSFYSGGMWSDCPAFVELRLELVKIYQLEKKLLQPAKLTIWNNF